jgi:hypothetical protein
LLDFDNNLIYKLFSVLGGIRPGVDVKFHENFTVPKLVQATFVAK